MLITLVGISEGACSFRSPCSPPPSSMPVSATMAPSTSGASAYLSIMIAASAVLIAPGAGHVLTAIFADLNKGFTYGSGEVFGTAFRKSRLCG